VKSDAVSRYLSQLILNKALELFSRSYCSCRVFSFIATTRRLEVTLMYSMHLYFKSSDLVHLLSEFMQVFISNGLLPATLW